MRKYHRIITCDTCRIFQVFWWSRIEFGEKRTKIWWILWLLVFVHGWESTTLHFSLFLTNLYCIPPEHLEYTIVLGSVGPFCNTSASFLKAWCWPLFCAIIWARVGHFFRFLFSVIFGWAIPLMMHQAHEMRHHILFSIYIWTFQSCSVHLDILKSILNVSSVSGLYALLGYLRHLKANELASSIQSQSLLSSLCHNDTVALWDSVECVTCLLQTNDQWYFLHCHFCNI